MEKNTHYCHPDLYPKYLKTIGGIKFTRREVDVIACTLTGRSAGEIARFLEITSKGVEAHLYNIRKKLEVGSRNGIIDFIEKSDRLPLLKKHYRNLQTQSAFVQALKKIPKPTNKNLSTSATICGKSSENITSFIQSLEYYLTLAGIKTSLDVEKDNKTIHPNNHIIYILNKPQLPQFQEDQKLKALSKNLNAIFLLLGGEDIPKMPDIRYVDFRDENSFYASIFEVVKKLLPDADLNEIIFEFDKRYKTIHGSSEGVPLHAFSSEEKALPKHGPFQRLSSNLFKNRKNQLIAAILLCLSIFSIWLLIGETSYKKLPQPSQTIQSDLIIPTESRLLQRPQLIEQIGNKLNQQKGIQTIALVGIIGMGGVGKTNIARQFGRLQNSSLVWEINAETKDSLINSFKDLAYTLAKTKDELEFIKTIQNSEDKEKQLLSFVKSHLKDYPNWLLIYDNVDTFEDIKNYLPQGHKVWGNGKVIITTRDSNIQNTSYINPENIIQVGELSSSESLTLFSKILYNYEPSKLSSDQRENALSFLNNIPSFPLDISLAAYYIKDTHITYEKYLEKINKSSEISEATQTNILRKGDNNLKTRYGIISLSFKKLIDINPEFKELLLFICLLDSQNIPKNLLETYKDATTADSFINALRKYSLITSETSIKNRDQLHTFSLHRSTQLLGKNFLLRLLNSNEKENFIKKIVSSVKSFHQLYWEKRNRNCANILMLIPHLEPLIHNLKEIGMLKAEHQQNLFFVLGYSHYSCSGNHLSAGKYLPEVFKKQYFSNNVLAHLSRDLASSSMDSSNVKEALFYCQKGIEFCKKISNSEVLYTSHLRIMGKAYSQQNNFAKAKYYLETALTKLPKTYNELQKEELSKIYAELASIYSQTYINRPQAKEAEEYAQKALSVLNTSHPFYKDANKSTQTLSCYISRHRAKLGEVYCRLGKYKQSLEEFREAQNIIDNHLDNCSHVLLKGQMFAYMGEALLRQQDLEIAKQRFTESIKILKELVGENETLIPRIFRAETLIRLKKLNEAYEDCSSVLRIGQKVSNNYIDIMYLTTFYHAAFIKYKQNDPKKSIEHFTDFFKDMKEFCKGFLDEKVYKELEDKGVFTIPSYDPKNAEETIKKCLENSVEIFTAIYGASHPFVRDYIVPNYNEAIKPWYKFW